MNRRMAAWWIVWNDLHWPSADTLDRIKNRAARMAEANINATILFGTHFRWDFLPYFELLHDYIAAVVEECHKVGIEVIDHHSVNLVHRYHNREEMRHVMIHSAPHLPLSPSFEAAKSWQWNGKYLNDWRMIDVETNEPLYYPQYAAEGFCHRNPEFREAYYEYAKKLVADTGIDGLMADDEVHYMHYRSCGCKYCREELKRRSGMDLPSATDLDFWGNFDNPAWRHWIDLRYDSCGEFMEGLRGVLPKKVLLLSCGGHSSAGRSDSHASDARQFLRGTDYANVEMSGNVPPYKHDPVTRNYPISFQMVSGAYHMAAAREKKAQLYNCGFGFSVPAVNIVWAVSKMCGGDCYLLTLKSRLGLPDSILDTLPDEADLAKQAYTYEKEHPELFGGDSFPSLAVFYSVETRNHTLFGNKTSGLEQDYETLLNLLCEKGYSSHTVFRFPKTAEQYPLVLIPSALRMTDAEQAELSAYLSAGGTVVALGPTAIDGCIHHWKLPNAVRRAPDAFFQYVKNGVDITQRPWMTEPFDASADANAWSEPRKGLYYNPLRASDKRVQAELLKRCDQFCRRSAVQVEQQKGYFISVFENNGKLLLHFLAKDYDTDIDHELDRIRFHRSRINLVNKVVPIGIGRDVKLKTDREIRVHTPFSEETAVITKNGADTQIRLPEQCAYFIVEVL